jgi:hypothetical protein
MPKFKFILQREVTETDEVTRIIEADDLETGLNAALAPSEEELLDRAEQKHNAQMLDGCETEDEFNAELRAQTQGR